MPPTPSSVPAARYRAAQRTIAVLIGLLAAALVSLPVVAASVKPEFDELLRVAKSDETVRRAAMAELIGQGDIWNAHPDPDVGRLFKHNVTDRRLGGAEISSNAHGFHDRPFKPRRPGVARVVVLGDSYAFGWGVEREKRVGNALERFLELGSGKKEVEVLTLALPSWNIVAECNYLRRNLDFYRPDLVVQVLYGNDLDDMHGVLGFGGLGRFSPQRRQAADGLVKHTTFPEDWEEIVLTPLTHHLDGESRSRYERAAREIGDLRDALDRRGARYLLVAQWTPPVYARRVLGRSLSDDEIVFPAKEFTGDRAHWVTETDNHWNAEGHRRVAQMLYGVIHARGLLPDLGLREWDEAVTAVAKIAAPGEARARAEPPPLEFYEHLDRLTFGEADRDVARQVYAGVDKAGRVSPYASLLLATGGKGVLAIRGRCLDRPDFRPSVARVFVDEVQVGEIPLDTREPFDLEFPLSSALRERPHVAVRFESTDWMHEGGRCVAFVLESVGLD